MSDTDARALFRTENAKVAADPAFKRLMALDDRKEYKDAEFYLAAGVAQESQWQRHIIADPKEVVLGRVARQAVRKYMDLAIENGTTIEEELSAVTIDPELQPFLDQELSVYTGVTFSATYDSLNENLERELSYNYLIDQDHA